MIPLEGSTPTAESIVEKMRGTLAGGVVSQGIASPIQPGTNLCREKRYHPVVISRGDHQ